MNPENWISAKETARKLGYAPEYVARLCRQGDLVCKRDKGSWLIREDSLESFVSRMEQEQVLRAKTLSRQFKRESKVQAIVPVMVPGEQGAAPVAAPRAATTFASWYRRTGRKSLLIAAALFFAFTAPLGAYIQRTFFAPAAISPETKIIVLGSTTTAPTTHVTHTANTYPVISRVIERASASADLSNFVTYDFFASQIERLQDSIADHQGSGGGSGGGLSDFSSLTAADIPDLSATYLPLAGGTLAGDLTLPYASTTALSATALCLSTDCRTAWPAGGSSFSYLFPSNATSTPIAFNGGLISASTTLAGNTLLANATTSNFSITNVLSSLLKTTAGGSVVAAQPGVDYLTDAEIFDYLFPSNATTTQIAFNGGLTAVGATTTALAVTGSSTVSSVLNVGGVINANGGVVGSLTGNASTATALQTGRTINGVTFDGTTNITITAASSTLLANDNTFSGANTFANPIVASITGNAGTVTNGVYTTTFNGLFDARFVSSLAATTSVASITTLPNLSLPYSQLTGAPSIAAYPFALAGNATSSLTQFNGGLTSYASTTIGGGFDTSGLTINGGATTTGSAYIAGSLGIGTAPGAKLHVNGAIAADSYSIGQNIVDSVNGSPWYGIGLSNVTLGDAGASSLTTQVGGYYGVQVVTASGALSFTQTGKLGIGTSSPTVELSVEGGALITGTVNASSYNAGGSQFIDSNKDANIHSLSVNGGYAVIDSAGVITSNAIYSSTFPYASTTVVSVGGALYVPAVSSLLMTDGNGRVGAAVAGADFLTPSTQTVRTDGNQNLFASYNIPNNVTSGNYNVALGYQALPAVTSGQYNVALGIDALQVNEDGAVNVAIGLQTLQNNISGSSNVAIGPSALINSTGSNNIGIGPNAGTNLTSGNNNIALGLSADFLNPTGSDQLTIGDTLYGDLGTNNIGLLANRYFNFGVEAEGFGSGGYGIRDNGGIIEFKNLGGDWATFSTTTGASFSYPFPSNATSTILAFNGGLTAYASSTIGNGTAGLTVSGNSTTTGNVYIAGNVGVGTTTPWGRVTISNSDSGTPNFVIQGPFSDDSVFFSAGNNIAVGTSTDLDARLTVHGGNGENLLTFSKTEGGAKAYSYYLSGSDLRLFEYNTGVGGAGKDRLTLQAGGNLGLGTTSPYAKLSVDGRGVFNQDVRANYFTATSTTVASTFPYASTTALSATSLCLSTDCRTVWPSAGSSFSYPFPSNATTTAINFSNGALLSSSTIGTLFATSSATLASTTLTGNTLLTSATSTNLAVTNLSIGSLTGLLKATAGVVSTATAGTDYITPTNLASAYPFQGTNNSTSTLTQFNGGLTAYASSTIGNGTQIGGLTISGGATTTGNAYFGGNVGVGTAAPQSNSQLTIYNATDPRLTLSNDTRNYFITSSSTADALYIGRRVSSNTADSNDLTISAAGNVGIGTSSPTQQLAVGNGGIAINRDSSLEPFIQFTGSGAQLSQIRGLTTGGLKVTNSGSTDLFTITNAGLVGIATTTPSTYLHVVGTTDAGLGANHGLAVFGQTNTSNIAIDQNEIMARNNGAASALFINNDGGTVNLMDGTDGVFTVNTDDLYVTATGLVGIGTTSPATPLDIVGNARAGTIISNSAATEGGQFVLGWTAALLGGQGNRSWNIDSDSSDNFRVFRVDASGSTLTGFSIASSSGRVTMPYASTTAFNVSGATYLTSLTNQSCLGTDSSGKVQAGTCGSTLTGTQGQVAYFSGTNTAVGTSSLFISPEGAIGIGTTTTDISGTTLDTVVIGEGATGRQYGLIVDKDDAASARISFANEGALSAGMFFGTSEELSFQTAATNRLTIDFSGNVGVGSTSPWARSSVDTSSLGSGVPSFVVGSSTRTDFVITQAGKIGIGTTSPVNVLDVYAASAAGGVRSISTVALGSASGGAFLAETNASSTAANQRIGGYFFGSFDGTAHNTPVGITAWSAEAWSASSVASYLRFETTGIGTTARTERMRIDANGNVGIGTASPTDPLTVIGTTTIGSFSAGVAIGRGLNVTSSNNTFAAPVRSGTYDPAVLARYLFGSVAQDHGVINSGTTWVQNRLVSDLSVTLPYAINPNGGNVGIGTTSPFAKLSIHANAGETNTTLFAVASSTASATTTLFSIDNTGIATFGATSGSGDALMQYAGDSNAWSVGYRSSDKAFVIASSTNFSGSAALAIAKNGNTTIVGSGTTCVIGSGTGATSCTSDARLKANIASISGQEALSKLSLIQGVTFNWADPSRDQTPQVGVIAQDVFKAFPQLVGSTTVNYKGVTSSYLTVGYEGLIGPIISGVNELDQRTSFIGTSTTVQELISATSTPRAKFATTTPWIASFEGASTLVKDALAALGDIAVRGMRTALYASAGIFDKVLAQTMIATTVNADEIRTEKLCIGSTCVTESQLQELLSGAQASHASGESNEPQPELAPEPEPTPVPDPAAPAPEPAPSPVAEPAPDSENAPAPDAQ